MVTNICVGDYVADTLQYFIPIGLGFSRAAVGTDGISSILIPMRIPMGIPIPTADLGVSFPSYSSRPGGDTHTDFDAK